MKKIYFLLSFNFLTLFCSDTKLVEIINKTDYQLSLDVPFLCDPDAPRVEHIYIDPRATVIYALQAPGYVYFSSEHYNAISWGFIPFMGRQYEVSAPHAHNPRELVLKISEIRRN